MAKRRWEDRNARLEFDMHYGRSGAVEITQEEVQLYEDRLLMIKHRGHVEFVTLDWDAYNELRRLFLQKEPLDALILETSKGLYEREHIHFNIRVDGKMEYYFAYFEDMPPAVEVYMSQIDSFVKKRFPGFFIPMKDLVDH